MLSLGSNIVEAYADLRCCEDHLDCVSDLLLVRDVYGFVLYAVLCCHIKHQSRTARAAPAMAAITEPAQMHRFASILWRITAQVYAMQETYADMQVE